MPDLIDTVYCLSCRKPMPASENVCPECGADQAAVRAERMAPTPKPPPTAKPTQPERTETVACPNCYTPVEPNHLTCRYCGRVIDDPGAQARFQAGNSPVFVGIGAVFIAMSLLCMLTPWYFVLGVSGVVFGHLAKAENRYSTAAGRVIFAGWAVVVFDFAVRSAITFFILNRAVSMVHPK